MTLKGRRESRAGDVPNGSRGRVDAECSVLQQDPMQGNDPRNPFYQIRQAEAKHNSMIIAKWKSLSLMQRRIVGTFIAISSAFAMASTLGAVWVLQVGERRDRRQSIAKDIERDKWRRKQLGLDPEGEEDGSGGGGGGGAKNKKEYNPSLSGFISEEGEPIKNYVSQRSNFDPVPTAEEQQQENEMYAKNKEKTRGVNTDDGFADAFMDRHETMQKQWRWWQLSDPLWEMGNWVKSTAKKS